MLNVSSQLRYTLFTATADCSQQACSKSRTYTQWRCFTPPRSLPDQEDGYRKFPNVANYLQFLFLLLLLLTFVQHDSKVLLQQAMSNWCDSNKKILFKKLIIAVLLFFLLLAWVVFATYTVHQEKKKCLRDMFLFL